MDIMLKGNCTQKNSRAFNATGSNIVRGRVTLQNLNGDNYGILPNQQQQKSSSVLSSKIGDAYGKISVRDMIATNASPQFDGLAVQYPVPDTVHMHFYKPKGLARNQKPKTTYLSEIIDNAKKPGGSRPGPTDYKAELALDYAKTHSTKRYQWTKMNKTTFAGEI